MRKPTILALALIGAASLTLSIPDHGYAAGPSLPIVGKLPIPAPPSVPGVPSLPGAVPGVPSLPSLPSIGAPPAGSLPGLPGVSPSDLVSQNVAYLEKPGGLSPAKAGALLSTASVTLLPLVPNTPESPSVLLFYAEVGGFEEIGSLPHADAVLLIDLLNGAAPGTPESDALAVAADEIASEIESSPAGPYEKSELTPTLKTAVREAQPVLNQTAKQLDQLPSLPSLPSGTLPSASSAPSLPSTSSLTKMASLPKSSSLPSTSSVTKEINQNVPSSSTVTKEVNQNVPSSSTVTKQLKTPPSSATVTKEVDSATKELPKT